MELVISDHNGDTSVFIDERGDDHIVVKHSVDKARYERDVTLGADTFAWDRAVERAQRARAFL